MKTLITLMILVCATTVSLAQKTVKKEVVKIETEGGREEKVVEKYKIITTTDIDIDEDDINGSTLKKLIEVLSEIEEGDSENERIVVKSSSPSEKTSISYAFKIDSDGEIETLEGTEELDIDGLKEKLTELSVSINDSDAIKLLVKKLKEKHTVIVKEIEEEKEKTKH